MTHSVDGISPQECLRKLATAHLGRLAFSHRALPAVHPANYIVDGHELVLRTADAPVLAAAAGNGSIVAFEVDEIDRDTSAGWSVVVTGRMREVTDQSRVRRYEEDPAFAPDSGPKRFLVISLDLLSGRSFSGATIL